MKESYSEGMANHTGLRSYASVRKNPGGTLIEVRAGRVLSREISKKDWSADVVSNGGRRNRRQRMPMLQENSTRSKTPSMQGNILEGYWEIPSSSAKADRIGKSKDTRR
jgi:hypothetical protein